MHVLDTKRAMARAVRCLRGCALDFRGDLDSQMFGHGQCTGWSVVLNRLKRAARIFHVACNHIVHALCRFVNQQQMNVLTLPAVGRR